MRRQTFFIVVASGALWVAGPAASAEPPASWDGLVQVPSKRLSLVYLQPGADFRGYTKILLEPTELAFHKNWQRDYNSSTRSLASQISDRDVQKAVSKGIAAASDIFSQAWTKAGYEIVNSPAPDVMTVKTGIVHIRVSAPDRPSAGTGLTFAGEAGSATLFVEARDSVTGALLGRAVDQRVAGDYSSTWRTSVSNRADFRELAEEWAAASVRGVTELKSLSPIRP